MPDLPQTVVPLSPADFTPRSKRILQFSAAQAMRFGSHYVGTEHILLALLGERDSNATHFLETMGVHPAQLAEKSPMHWCVLLCFKMAGKEKRLGTVYGKTPGFFPG